MRPTSRAALAALLTLAPVLPACAQDAPPPPAPPKIGQALEHPADMARKFRNYGFLDGAPSVKITEPGKFVVSFKTMEATPPANIYYGFNTLDEELDYPRYRWQGSEKVEEGATLFTEHAVEVDFGRRLKYLPNTPFEPRVVYKVEVILPRFDSTRTFEGRVYFDPETLGDRVNVTAGPYVEQLSHESATICWETDRPAEQHCSYDIEGTYYMDMLDAESSPLPNGGAAHSAVIKFAPEMTEGGHSKCSYWVGTPEHPTREYSLDIPAKGETKFEFATMVDCREGVGGGDQAAYGVAGASLYRLNTDLYYRGADFVLFAGDLINGYTTDTQDFRNQLHSFRQAMAPIQARIPVYEGIGNHEALLDTFDDGSYYGLSLDKMGEESAEAIFAEVFSNPANGPAPEGPTAPTYDENVYWFDHGNARFFMLNNNYWWSSDPHNYGGNLEGYFLPNQVAWLRERVAEADADDSIEHLFFAAQEPIFPNGGHTDDAMWYDGGDTNGDGKIDAADIGIVENRNEIWEIVAGSPKTVAFITGDEHAYCRLVVTDETDVGHKRKADGSEATFKHPVWQITSGGAGAPWYDQDKSLPWSGNVKKHCTMPHYAFFRVDGDDVLLEAYAETGQLIDEAILRLDGANADE